MQYKANLFILNTFKNDASLVSFFLYFFMVVKILFFITVFPEKYHSKSLGINSGAFILSHFSGTYALRPVALAIPEIQPVYSHPVS